MGFLIPEPGLLVSAGTSAESALAGALPLSASGLLLLPVLARPVFAVIGDFLMAV